MNCCFILRPQFGQIRLLALIKSLLELGNNFIGGHTAGKQLFQYGFYFSFLDSSAAFFSAATFFASALESSFTATFKADFFYFSTVPSV